MTTYAWPTGRDFVPQQATLRVISNGRSNDSSETGVSQTVTKPGSKWGWSLAMAPMRNAVRDDFEGFMTGLSGMEHRIQVFDWQRQRPRGTCNTTGVTVASNTAQFATSVALAGCGAGGTLLRGDWIGFSTGQLCRVAANATADGSGAMTVQVRHSLRVALTSASAVTLVKPTALYILTSPIVDLPRGPGPSQPAMGLDLIEVFA